MSSMCQSCASTCDSGCASGGHCGGGAGSGASDVVSMAGSSPPATATLLALGAGQQQGEHKCDLCDKTFVYYRNLQVGTLVTNPMMTSSCLQQHLKAKHDQMRYECPLIGCNKGTVAPGPA